MLHRILVDNIDVEPCGVSVCCVSRTFAYRASYQLSFLSHCITDCLQLRNYSCSTVGIIVYLAYQVVRGGIDTSDKLETSLNTANLFPAVVLVVLRRNEGVDRIINPHLFSLVIAEYQAAFLLCGNHFSVCQLFLDLGEAADYCMSER